MYFKYFLVFSVFDIETLTHRAFQVTLNTLRKFAVVSMNVTTKLHHVNTLHAANEIFHPETQNTSVFNILVYIMPSRDS
jgi:hypothetical protein